LDSVLQRLDDSLAAGPFGEKVVPSAVGRRLVSPDVPCFGSESWEPRDDMQSRPEVGALRSHFKRLITQSFAVSESVPVKPWDITARNSA
jgi:hypothetical protein